MKKIVIIGMLIFVSLLVAKESFVLDGFLRNKSGMPINGATLRSSEKESQTDKKGYYKFTFDEKGEYEIIIEKDSIEFSRNVNIHKNIQRLNLQLDFRENNYSRPQTGRLAGKVFDQDGKPVSYVGVKIKGTDKGALTDEKGRFFLRNIPPGTYTIECNPMGYHPRFVEGVVIRVNATTTQKIEIVSSSLELISDVTVKAEVSLIVPSEIGSSVTMTAQDIGAMSAGSSNAGGEVHFKGGRSNEVVYSMDGMSVSNPVDSNIGFSTGGAKDIGNFRQNIENGYTPQLTDITVEGLFYDYFFDTGQTEECNQLFCPSYAKAISKSPIDEKEKLFMSVGLNSGMKESDFSRKKLNLVIVLDISGSMQSAFDRYYYDKKNRTLDDDDEIDWKKSKIEVAKESIVGLTKHLQKDDNFGVVLFNNSGHLAKPINLVGNTDLESIQKHIMDIRSNGGTNMEAGLSLGTKIFNDVKFKNRDEYENRIIFLTDAQPNRGRYAKSDFLKITRENAANDIYTTFIGIGIDFNTKLIEQITKVKGANYFAVHDSKNFNKRMDDEFDFMVTPLVFDLQLQLKSNNYKIVNIYGSPEANISTNELMKINTLFPSKRSNEQTRGGLVLLELEKDKSKSGSLDLEVFYEDRSGKRFNNSENIKFPKNKKIQYDNLGIRKGVLLVNYVNILKEWISHERGLSDEKSNKHDDWQYNNDKKNLHNKHNRSKWEQRSQKLKVSKEFKKKFKKFKTYFESEMNYLADENLDQELKILDILIN